MSLTDMISRFIYYPDPKWIVTPDGLGLQAEDLHLPSEEGVDLHAWFFPFFQERVQRPRAPAHPRALERTGTEREDHPLATLLFCHGNAGNASHRLENVYYLLQAGFQVLLFDYRGYGHSSDQPSETGLYRDATTAWEHLVAREDTAGAPRIIFGRSLGGAVAVDLACRTQADGLILESTFTSIRTLTRFIFPVPLPGLPVRFDSLSKIGNLQMPLLGIHGEQDELIPDEDGQALFTAAPEPKSWFPIPGAGHNDTYIVGGRAYFERLATFAASLLH